MQNHMFVEDLQKVLWILSEPEPLCLGRLFGFFYSRDCVNSTTLKFLEDLTEVLEIALPSEPYVPASSSGVPLIGESNRRIFSY